jgi:energy-coupling factor transporter ATP-binding protein EcfA2
MTKTSKRNDSPAASNKLSGGFTALGTLGTNVVILSGLSKEIFKLPPSELKEMALLAICGVNWCNDHYLEFDEKKEEYVLNHKRLSHDIIRSCQEQGPYVEALECRAGVSKARNGALMINGAELWLADGTRLEHGVHDGQVYPSCGDIGFGPETPAATDDDVAHVLNCFRGIDYREDLAPEMLLGWLGVAFTSFALERRPHILVTGGAGVGKSTLLRSISMLLGNMGFSATGAPTSAGLHQSIGGTLKAVVIDEFEADPSRRNCRDVLELARKSYSLQPGDNGVVRGSMTGVAKSYPVYSPFIAGGISPGKMEAADVTRWVVLEAKSRKVDAASLTDEEARDIGPRLAKKFVKNWSVFQQAQSMVRQSILTKGGTARLAETVGTLLSGYLAFTSNRVPTVKEVEALVERIGVQERAAANAVSDEQLCLQALLSRVLPFKFMQGDYMLTRSLSISEAIQKVCEDPTATGEIIGRLAQLGLRVAFTKGNWQLFVANNHEHAELRKLFSGTKWSGGGWSIILRRLPGGKEATQRLGAGFGAAKVTVFDLPRDLLPAVEEAELMAA